MNNISRDILNKTIRELLAKKSMVEKELRDIDKTLNSLDVVLLEVADNYRKTNSPLVGTLKSRRKHKPKGVAKITESMVRDAAIDLARNRPDRQCLPPRKAGHFLASDVCERIGVAVPNNKVKGHLEKFYIKDILARAPYKNGYQYMYRIPNAKESNTPENTEKREGWRAGGTVPGTGNGKVHTRDKDVEKFVNKAKLQGFTVDHRGSDHIKVINNKDGRSTTISATSNTSHHATRVRSDLQKIGVEI